MAQQVPAAAPVLLSVAQWGASKFRVSHQIESIFDQAIESLKQQGIQPPQPSPLQQAEVAEKVASAQERQAKAANQSMDARFKSMQLDILQPQPQLPPAAPAMPAAAGAMPL
jgi:hypothetical protein